MPQPNDLSRSLVALDQNSIADLDRVAFAVCIPGSLAARLAPTSG
jgi:hypothetical protein